MDARVREFVRVRAYNRCEYCQSQQEASPLIRLQMEHIIPIKHGGGDELENLALAYAECNLKKSSDLAGIDPDNRCMKRPRSPSFSGHRTRCQ